MAEETGLEEDWNSLWCSMTNTLIAEGQRCCPLLCVCVCVFACLQHVAVSLFISYTKISLIMQIAEHFFHDCVFPDLPVSWF